LRTTGYSTLWRCHLFQLRSEFKKVLLLQFAMKRLYRFYRLALTRMSFRDFPLRYDRRGGSLKTFLSCGWFCIKCHFPMSIFKLGNAGWYCVTKGIIFFVRFCFYFEAMFSFRKFDFWEMFFYCCCWVTSILKACGEVFIILTLPPLMKPFVTAGEWHE